MRTQKYARYSRFHSHIWEYASLTREYSSHTHEYASHTREYASHTYSRVCTPYSRVRTPYSQLRTPYSQVRIPYSLVVRKNCAFSFIRHLFRSLPSSWDRWILMSYFQGVLNHCVLVGSYQYYFFRNYSNLFFHHCAWHVSRHLFSCTSGRILPQFRSLPLGRRVQINFSTSNR